MHFSLPHYRISFCFSISLNLLLAQGEQLTLLKEISFIHRQTQLSHQRCFLFLVKNK